jgi:conjugative transfer region protein TrbK
MRGRLLNMSAIGRAAGFALVGVALVAAALHFGTSTPPLHSQQASPIPAADPLTDELQRCQAFAAQAKDDAACEATWAESRRRFFTYQPASSAADSPASSPKSSGR